MQKALHILLTLCLCAFSACTWFKKGPQDVIPESRERIILNKTVDPDALHSGGKLLLIPFTAGVGVAATDELDQVAFYIVRGIAEELKLQGSPFEVLTNSTASQAEYVMRGHIVEKKEDRSLIGFLNPFVKRLKVQGRIYDEKNGKVVLYFTREIKSDTEKVDFKRLGEILGGEIGRFIHTGQF